MNAYILFELYAFWKKLILFIVTQNSESIDKNHIYVENEYYDSLNVTS